MDLCISQVTAQEQRSESSWPQVLCNHSQSARDTIMKDSNENLVAPNHVWSTSSENIPKVSAKLSEKHVQVISIWSWAIAPNLGSLLSTHSRVWVSRITLVLSRNRPPAVQWHHHGLIAADEVQKGYRYVRPKRPQLGDRLSVLGNNPGFTISGNSIHEG